MHARLHQVDVDENDEVAAACAIQSMPTFHFYKNVSAARWIP
jgi:thioredoxin-like negative regulator of GroEL